MKEEGSDSSTLMPEGTCHAAGGGTAVNRDQGGNLLMSWTKRVDFLPFETGLLVSYTKLCCPEFEDYENWGQYIGVFLTWWLCGVTFGFRFLMFWSSYKTKLLQSFADFLLSFCVMANFSGIPFCYALGPYKVLAA
ncbi:unnamed protein product [Linum tenue]|uniref:Uncharacterized protein n=1 Tax=Linum tenue TaxID=586396 RepID=A0AAV0JXP6_9ROSI|nr:unnamed protein product [Linum tenue]